MDFANVSATEDNLCNKVVGLMQDKIYCGSVSSLGVVLKFGAEMVPAQTFNINLADLIMDMKFTDPEPLRLLERRNITCPSPVVSKTVIKEGVKPTRRNVENFPAYHKKE
ncbi:hypothetical protein TNCV_4900091 [Trichonephila clavipes]|nr:hypothetical protein TNCV_4900091 [Trichonephila clavipes]